MEKIKSFTVCSKCGKKKFARKEVIKKRVEKGNLENWICRDCLEDKLDIKQIKKATKKHVEKIQKATPINEEENEDFFAK